jgi:hypothetical protein
MVDMAMERGGPVQDMASLGPAGVFLKANGRGLAAQVVVNFALPSIIYGQARPALGEVGGLIASAAPPMLWSVVELVRRRRVDALSLMALAGIGLSVLAFFGSGSVHALQLREKLVTVLIGLVLLGSAAIGRPLVYQFARAGLARHKPSELAAFEALREAPGFRRAMTLMTLVWGFSLLGEAAVSCALVYALSVREYLIVGPLLGHVTMGAVGLWTFWYARRQRRRRLARQARVVAATPVLAAA